MYRYIHIYIYICGGRLTAEGRRPPPPHVRGGPTAELRCAGARDEPSYSRECLGHHRMGTPGVGDCYQVLIKCFMSGNSLIK